MALFGRRPEHPADGDEQQIAYTDHPDLEEIRDVLRRASLGDLDVRVVHVTDGSPHAGLARDLNHLLDLVDSYMRESEATLTAAEEGRTYRRFLTRGMLGAFATSAQQVNAATSTIGALRAPQDAPAPPDPGGEPVARPVSPVVGDPEVDPGSDPADPPPPRSAW